MQQPENIDIIIPIYNAFEDLQKCIASIFACTDLNRHRLLLVNDASPDERILPYIKSLENTNILVIENENNLGFSGSINHGIRVSSNRDVILLNSDTLVTSDWVEKIIACAYSAPEIATVTPLSNNATLCSVPKFLQENSLPDGFTLGQYAQLIEMVSLRSYPRIPVANGFCMYIKREVLEKIGLFDMETFERGYGEENDFCYRAGQIGYCHAMCDDTYIYHTGTTSFISDEKRKYIEAHEKILNKRYPEQNHAVAVHCRDNPNERIQENIKLWTGLMNGRSNLLYLVQADFREDAHDHLGGTQLHVKDMTEVMRGTYNVFVAARNVDYLNLTAYTETSEYTFKFFIGKAPKYTEFRNKKFAELYGKILDTFRISFVHIHHTKDLTLELYYEAHKRDVPIISTLHDYYTICPSIKMVNCHGELCIGDTGKQCCQECQQKNAGLWNGIDYISIWRKEHKAALEMASEIVTPSKSASKIILSYYPELSAKLHVIPHGVRQMKCNIKELSDQFRIAFIGGISKEKGSYISYQLIKNGPRDVHWFLFGVWGYNELSMLDKSNYTKTGLYERDELPALIEKYKIDLICILPIWPETYCYTLSEAIMCGVPVIATNIGALGERMCEMDCGWIVSPENAYEESLAIIKRIKDRGLEYQGKKRNLQKFPVKSLEDMGLEYQSLYKYLLKKTNPSHITSSGYYKDMYGAYLSACNPDICFTLEGNHCGERIQALEAELNQIKNSFEYKCSKAFVRVPLAKNMLTLLYSIYIKAMRK